MEGIEVIKKVAVVLFVTLVLQGLIGGCGSKSSEVKTSAPTGSMDMTGQINSGFSNSVSDKATQAVPTSPPTATETSANGVSPTAVTQSRFPGDPGLILAVTDNRAYPFLAEEIRSVSL